LYKWSEEEKRSGATVVQLILRNTKILILSWFPCLFCLFFTQKEKNNMVGKKHGGKW